MEPIYQKEFQVDDRMTDCFGRLLPWAALYLVQEMAGDHVNALALDPSPEERGLIWVISRHRLQITRLPLKGEKIRLETWPMPTTRVAYPRSVVAYDSRGGELFRSVSLWVLMDRESRAMILPGKSGVPITGILRGNELPSPRSLPPTVGGNRSCRRVVFSDLDGNMHMNNCRYLQWIGDLLPSDFHRSHQIADVTMCYLAEAREGQELEILWQFGEDGTLHADIYRPENDRKIHILAANIRYSI